jgi:flavin reductase (DIM6/NTAB) family NADH-FMN oxidoreductase RutF
MSEINGSSIAEAMDQIPRGLFILTTAHNGVRAGVLTRWVQPCSVEPPLVMVALPQGLPVEPLMRDNHAFALCQIAADDILLRRIFSRPCERTEDPFFSLALRSSANGSPIIQRALAFLDCTVARHVDLDTDYRLFVGHVREGGLLTPGATPAIETGAVIAHRNGAKQS